MQEYVLNTVNQYYLLTLLTYPFKCCTLLEVIGCWFLVSIVFLLSNTPLEVHY